MVQKFLAAFAMPCRVFRAAAIAALLIMLAQSRALAGDLGAKWRVGFGHQAISGYLQARGACTAPWCVTNSDNGSLIEIQSRLYDLLANQHVGIFREIVPLNELHPVERTFNYSYAADVIRYYSGYNAHLVLSFGLPLPAWMTKGTQTYINVMPDSDEDWNTLMNYIAVEVVNLVGVLWNDPRISRDWMRTRLFLDGFNEFDSLKNAAPPFSNSNSKATPQRAAQLYNAIVSRLSAKGIQINSLSPSIVGVHPVYDIPEYLQEYYRQQGGGLPNAHIYLDIRKSPAAADFVRAFNARIEAINSKLPAVYKNNIFIGEVGAAARNEAAYCQSSDQNSMDPTQREGLFEMLAKDADVNARLHSLVFWRLMKLRPDPSYGCEAFFGVASRKDVAPYIEYESAGKKLFDYLKAWRP